MWLEGAICLAGWLHVLVLPEQCPGGGWACSPSWPLIVLVPESSWLPLAAGARSLALRLRADVGCCAPEGIQFPYKWLRWAGDWQTHGPYMDTTRTARGVCNLQHSGGLCSHFSPVSRCWAPSKGVPEHEAGKGSQGSESTSPASLTDNGSQLPSADSGL